ncbi:MAG: hypothetical protein J6Q22_10345 [Prevotella sp.]|nr:hypothetical protein [Prevotella sp.]
MKRKSRHKRKIELLNKLVKKTDYYIAHVWNGQGISLHGKIDNLGRQRFVRFGDCTQEWHTPWLRHYSVAGKVYFALMPRTKVRFGIVLTGWNELKWFVQEEIAKKERNETDKGSL